MAFHDDRLPEIIESGAEYGPRFNTAIQTTTGGKERRVAYWSAPKYEGNIATGIQGQPGLDAGLAFFHARQGRLHTFPFKDWGDFTATLQAIATGDGTTQTFTLRKGYTSGGTTRYRTNLLPVTGTVHVFLDAVEAVSGWTLNRAAGTITFATAPTLAAAITATFEFDNHVRFDTDHWAVTLEQVEIGQVSDIPIIEVPIA